MMCLRYRVRFRLYPLNFPGLGFRYFSMGITLPENGSVRSAHRVDGGEGQREARQEENALIDVTRRASRELPGPPSPSWHQTAQEGDVGHL